MSNGSTSDRRAARRSEPMLRRIEEAVTKALNLLLERATQDDEIHIVDHKSWYVSAPDEGPLQDCEFGMILVLGREWLQEKRGRLSGKIGDEEEVERVIVELVQRIADRALAGPKGKELDAGGGLEGSPVFFTGAPYTSYVKQRKDAFSSNLDAAMITLGFFVPALKMHNEALRNTGLEGLREDARAKLPEFVDSLRDAALFICNEGIEYALQCRVQDNDRFDGFSSDPGSTTPGEDSFLDRPEDRLFFSWTACESISDLVEWREEYLERIEDQVASELLATIRRGIGELEGALQATGNWCEKTFENRFRTKKHILVSDLVERVLGGGEYEDTELDDLRDFAHHVYHISQYASIRSLVPELTTTREVREIFEWLHVLVADDIRGSQLDGTKHDDLFSILVRNYKLGSGEPREYTDDAWYPLVVRSLAGLLSRTIRDIAMRGNRKEVVELAIEYRRTLQDHVEKMLARRPGDRDETEKEDPAVVSSLWSFLGNEPYILYATQRTIFALICYGDFLIKVDEFVGPVGPDGGEEPDETPEAKLYRLLSTTLSETLIGPAVQEFLRRLASLADASTTVALPAEEWAAATIGAWLVDFAKIFHDCQAAESLEQQADRLRAARDYANRYRPSNSLRGNKKKGAEENSRELREQIEKIENLPDMREKLHQQDQWTKELLVPILFKSTFLELVGPPERLREFMGTDRTSIGKMIESAVDLHKSLRELDPGAKLS